MVGFVMLQDRTAMINFEAIEKVQVVGTKVIAFLFDSPDFETLGQYLSSEIAEKALKALTDGLNFGPELVFYMPNNKFI